MAGEIMGLSGTGRCESNGLHVVVASWTSEWMDHRSAANGIREYLEYRLTVGITEQTLSCGQA